MNPIRKFFDIHWSGRSLEFRLRSTISRPYGLHHFFCLRAILSCLGFVGSLFRSKIPKAIWNGLRNHLLFLSGFGRRFARNHFHLASVLCSWRSRISCYIHPSVQAPSRFRLFLNPVCRKSAPYPASHIFSGIAGLGFRSREKGQTLSALCKILPSFSCMYYNIFPLKTKI